MVSQYNMCAPPLVRLRACVCAGLRARQARILVQSPSIGVILQASYNNHNNYNNHNHNHNHSNKMRDE